MSLLYSVVYATSLEKYSTTENVTCSIMKAPFPIDYQSTIHVRIKGTLACMAE
ncbi:hypothetical protein [Peribacillus sp. NPDC097895]|uniref:hypothetical protein n=1 Tax=Peribacillus sp. NPDC097895 TaxID=3390619 RepID=UPI003D06B45D